MKLCLLIVITLICFAKFSLSSDCSGSPTLIGETMVLQTGSTNLGITRSANGKGFNTVGWRNCKTKSCSKLNSYSSKTSDKYPQESFESGGITKLETIRLTNGQMLQSFIQTHGGEDANENHWYAQYINEEGETEGERIKLASFLTLRHPFSTKIIPRVSYSGGGFIAIWKNYLNDFQANKTFVQLFSNEGYREGPLSPICMDPSDDCWDPSITEFGDGTFAVGYHYLNSSLTNVIGRIEFFTQDGSFSDRAEVIPQETNDISNFQIVSSDSASKTNYWCLWMYTGYYQHDTNEPEKSGIYAQVRSISDNSIIQSQFQIDKTNAFNQINFKTLVLVDPTDTENQNLLIVWETKHSDGQSLNIQYSVYNFESYDAVVDDKGVNTHVSSDQYNPVFTLFENGKFIIAWNSNGQDSDGTAVSARIFSASGSAFTSEFRVNLDESGDQYVQSLLPLDDEHCVVFYLDEGSSKQKLIYQKIDQNGEKVDSAVEVSSWDASANYEHYSPPSLINGLESEDFFAFYLDVYKASGYYWKDYDFDGNLVTDAILISNYLEYKTHDQLNREQISLITLTNTNIAFLRSTSTDPDQDNPTSNTYNLNLQYIESSGDKYLSDTEINKHKYLNKEFSTIQLYGDNFFVVWEYLDGTYNHPILKGCLIDNDGNIVKSEFKIHSDRQQSQMNPSLSSLPALKNKKNFIIVYQVNEFDNSGYGIVRKIYDNDLEEISEELQVNNYTLNDQDNPKISSFSNLISKRAVVIWSSFDQHQTGEGYDIYGQILRYDSSLYGNEIFISTNTDEKQDTDVSLITLSSDHFLVSWISSFINGSSPRIKATIQDNFGNSLYGIMDPTDNTDGWDEINPQILALDCGSWVISWSSDTSNNGIYDSTFFRVFSNDGTPLISKENLITSKQHSVPPSIFKLSEYRFLIIYDSKPEQENILYGKIYTMDESEPDPTPLFTPTPRPETSEKSSMAVVNFYSSKLLLFIFSTLFLFLI
ncbi:hypothetical protein M0812_07808 [Anaeramoeba flamelloides]|uniref:Uncharacterized protein n=1 Tax=Anaeramoeba flamelloides TaxID=1746091 RepID=A0AAV8A0I1_9EUKA|nr:hypothetical protein M0812_07808 [Anaeramoeba flamelloides]